MGITWFKTHVAIATTWRRDVFVLFIWDPRYWSFHKKCNAICFGLIEANWRDRRDRWTGC